MDLMEWENPSDAYKNQRTGTFTLVDRHSENEEGMIDCLHQDYAIRNLSWPIVCVIALVPFVFGAVLASLPTLATGLWASCLSVEDTGDYFLLKELKDTCSSYFDGGEDHLEDV